jgi:hypothetical protein
MRTKFLLSAAGLLLATAPILGHHAFGGEFDPNKPVLLKGPVTKVEVNRTRGFISKDLAGRHQEWMGKAHANTCSARASRASRSSARCS